LDLRIGKLRLRDRFEWDLSSSMSPEEFAQILVNDLGVSSEFVTIISHNIREQIFKIKQEGELYNPFALESRHRGDEEARGWCPTLEAVGEEDIDFMKSGRDRSRRYMKEN
jgi:chromatin structure-remodeling complex subunit SFH1